MCATQPYEIPFRALLPKGPGQLARAGGAERDARGYGTLRMEPVMMNLGMACGVATVLEPGRPAGVEVGELREELGGRGQVVNL